MPSTIHDVADGPALHCPDPDAEPDSVNVRSGTGPPAAETTVNVMAIRGAQGGGMQSASFC